MKYCRLKIFTAPGPFNKTKEYRRGDFVEEIMQKCLTKQTWDHGPIENILMKYLDERINPLYQNYAVLPKKIYACGYCKEIFFRQSNYISHCLQLGCPINHQRSTFFIYEKQNGSKITNQKIETIIGSQNLATLLKTPIEKSLYYFSEFDLIKKEGFQTDLFRCGKCSKVFNIRLENNFISECLYKCQSWNHEKTSHTFKVRYFEQKTQEFVRDVSNFYLNANCLTVFAPSYPLITPNQELSNYKNDKFCQNCHQSFDNLEDMLIHSMFQCKQKPNQRSSHLIKFKKSHYMSRINSETIKIKQKPEKKNTNREIGALYQIQQKQILQILEVRFNDELYFEYKQLFKDIYFCAHCLNYFSRIVDYLAHFIVYLCKFNQKRSSHFFFSIKTGKQIQIKDIQNLVDSAFLAKAVENVKLFDSIKQFYFLIDNNTNKIYRQTCGKFVCGKCQKQYIRNYNYIDHCIRHCFSPENPKNSHRIALKYSQKGQKTFEKHLIGILYALQIEKTAPGKQYQLQKNKLKQKLELPYFCSICEGLFQNKYEYVFHSIYVCQSLQNLESSHRITQVQLLFNPQNPLDLVIQRNPDEKNKNQPQEPSQKITFDKYKSLKTSFEKPRQIQMKEKSKPKSIKNVTQAKEELKQLDHTISTTLQTQRYNLRQMRPSIQNQHHKHEQKRFLFINLGFFQKYNSSHEELKQIYFCGKCKQTFKRSQIFIEHFQYCKQFENIRSSHFYITIQRNKELDKQSGLNFSPPFSKNLGKAKDIETNYPQFFQNLGQLNYYNSDKYVCGCGHSDDVTKFIKHVCYVHTGNIPKGSSHIILSLKPAVSRSGPGFNFSLPTKVPMIDPNHLFVCPCRPIKKYQYDKFIEHVLIKHGGKVPSFIMRKSKLNKN